MLPDILGSWYRLLCDCVRKIMLGEDLQMSGSEKRIRYRVLDRLG